MDHQTLYCIAEELNRLLQNSFINKIHQPLSRDIVLKLRGKFSGERQIMLSADPQLGRAHLTTLRIPNPPRPPRFCAYLRAHLQGARINSIHCDAADRVLFIEASRGPADNRIELKLILELLGRDSNILLIDGKTNIILECLHRIPEKEITTRAVLPGFAYESPPPNPIQKTVLNECKVLRPGLTISSKGTSILTLQAHPNRDNVFNSVNEAADCMYGDRLNRALLESFKRNVGAPIVQRIRSLTNRLKKIQNDADRLEQYSIMLDHGELLKANLGKIKKGMTEITVQDWMGNNITIHLNPAWDAVANMNQFFKKSAKARRGKKIVQERFDATIEEKRALEDHLYFIQSAENVAEIESTLCLGSKETENKKKTRIQNDSEPIRIFESESGNRVLVGKNARGNELLVRKYAAAKDMWFHVKDYPGAHVVLILGGKKAGEDDIGYAARLAVTFSKANSAGKAEVMVTEVENLSRIKGGMPGQVTIKKFTSLVATPIPNLMK